MEASIRSDDPTNMWKYGSFRDFARKYNQLLDAIAAQVTFPPV